MRAREFRLNPWKALSYRPGHAGILLARDGSDRALALVVERLHTFAAVQSSAGVRMIFWMQARYRNAKRHLSMQSGMLQERHVLEQLLLVFHRLHIAS
jgi:hypothetical protein